MKKRKEREKREKRKKKGKDRKNTKPTKEKEKKEEKRKSDRNWGTAACENFTLETKLVSILAREDKVLFLRRTAYPS